MRSIELSTVYKAWNMLAPVQRRSAILLVVLVFIGMAMEMLGIGLIIPAMTLMLQDNLAARYPSVAPMLKWLGDPDPKTLVVVSMLSLVVIYLIKNLYLAFLSWKQTRFAFDVLATISRRLFTIYLRQPYTFHLQRNSAQLIHNLTGEVGRFVSNILIPVMTLLTEGLVLFGIAVLLFAAEPLGALASVLIIGGAAWAFQHFTRIRVIRWGEAQQYHSALRIQYLQEGLGGAKDVKLLGREDDFIAQFDMHNTQTARMTQLNTVLQQLPRLWLEVLAVMGMAVLVLVMLYQEKSVPNIVPVLGLFAVAAFRLMPSVGRVLGSVQGVHYGLSVVDTLYEELQLDESSGTQSDDGATAIQCGIDLVDVAYSYPDAQAPALKQITLSVRKGESVGFIGPSGSGKSTLVDIILGLLTPNSGRVAIDGQDIQQNLRSWQNQIGYVPQSIYLTDDSLRRNVAFGLASEQIDDDAVKRAIHAAQLEEFVAGLPDGLETIVGEHGVRLSGGQRQRIGIARALYHDPDVLVLDEATSALDTDTEHGVMQAVEALHGSKTVLIIAHRLSTVEQCDRLYRLEQGMVVEEGVPDTMIAKSKGEFVPNSSSVVKQTRK